MNAQIAAHLNIAESLIAEIQEWANVLFVKLVSGRPRFVSKKAVKMNAKVIKSTNTWGGDTLILAEVQGERRIFIGRHGVMYGDRSVLIKDVTAQLRGKTLAEMMESGFDDFYKLPLVEDPCESLKLAA